MEPTTDVMQNEKKTLTARTEEFFLSILRVFILLVLAGCLIGVGISVFSAFSGMNEKPDAYKVQGVDPEQFKKELSAILGQKADAETVGEETSPESVTQKTDPALQKEIDAQFSLASNFVSAFGRQYNNPEGLKSTLLEKGKEISADKTANGLLEYAKGRTSIFTIAFGDKALKDQLLKRSHLFEKYLPFAFDYYDNFNSEQQRARQEFEEAEQARVAAEKASAQDKLKFAAGLFAMFLLLCLILVLVKIERNLRGTRIVS